MKNRQTDQWHWSQTFWTPHMTWKFRKRTWWPPSKFYNPYFIASIEAIKRNNKTKQHAELQETARLAENLLPRHNLSIATVSPVQERENETLPQSEFRWLHKRYTSNTVSDNPVYRSAALWWASGMGDKQNQYGFSQCVNHKINNLRS